MNTSLKSPILRVTALAAGLLALALGSVMSASLQAVLKENPDYRSVIEDATPQRRIAPASELVETVQYMASDASSFMTGQIITLDGGRSLVDVVAAPAH